MTKGPRCCKCGQRFPNRAKRDIHEEGCDSSTHQLIRCGHFGTDVTVDDTSRGFMICVHVMNGAQPVHFLEAMDDSLGEVLCGLPKQEHEMIENLRLVCAICARMNGLAPAA
jgi:hypothetical protein